MTVDEPNVVVPFANSYNTRGIAGYTSTVTNALDQRKINLIYEPVHNELTGKVTLQIAKRPGVDDVGSSYGSSGQAAYLWDIAAGATTNAAANRWVFSTSSNDVRASDTSTTTVIVTAAGYVPAFVDKTAISGTDTVVVQIRNASGTQRVFYASAIGTWTEITDSNFTGLAHQGKMEFLDGFGFISTRNRIYNTDLNSLSTVGVASYIDRRASQDIATGLAKLGEQIVSFGTATMEIYRNVGSATFSPLAAVPQLAQRYGLASTIVTGQRHYTAIVDGKLYWVGQNPGGVYAYNGQTVEKASSIAIDKILAERQFYALSCVGFQGQRALAICLDTPDAATQRGLLFFPRWNDWFEWNSTVFIPQASPRLESVMLGVGSNQHKLYSFSQSTDNWLDAGSDVAWTYQFRMPKDDNKRAFMRWCGVRGDTARSASSIAVTASDDDGQTFNSLGSIDLTQQQKKHIYGCGSYTDRVMRLTNTANLADRMESFIARVD